MRRLAAITLVLATIASSSSLAVQPEEMLKDPKLEARARELSRELRCMVCQNQSIDESEAPLARDLRLLVRHLLPAARGFIAVQMTLLIPGFIIAEATLSCVGLGFPDPVASWGTMLHDASSNLRVFADFPWLLSPAAAMFLTVLSFNLVGDTLRALTDPRQGAL